jgi:hypothetical protein
MGVMPATARRSAASPLIPAQADRARVAAEANRTGRAAQRFIEGTGRGAGQHPSGGGPSRHKPGPPRRFPGGLDLGAPGLDLSGMKAAVVVFPGSNCDRDCRVAVERSTGAAVEMVWHGEAELPSGLDLIVLPGGFSYGDYLRCGAMAAQSPVMAAVRAQAERGVAGPRRMQRVPGALRGWDAARRPAAQRRAEVRVQGRGPRHRQRPDPLDRLRSASGAPHA